MGRPRILTVPKEATYGGALAQTCKVTAIFRHKVLIPIKTDEPQGYQTFAKRHA